MASRLDAALTRRMAALAENADPRSVPKQHKKLASLRGAVGRPIRQVLAEHGIHPTRDNADSRTAALLEKAVEHSGAEAHATPARIQGRPSPPPAESGVPIEVRGLVAVLHTLPPWGRVVFLVVLLAAAVACRMDAAFGG